MRSFLVLIAYSSLAFCQDGRSTISVGAGGSFPAGGELTFTSQVPDSAAFSAAYEFRLFKYFAPEVSVVDLAPLIPQYGEYPMPPLRTRVTLVSLGARGVLPIGRAELFAGGAAVHVSTSDQELLNFNSSPWIWQINGGGRIALDKRRRFWIGPTVRLSRDGGRPTQEWVSLTGDFGFRF